jgi:hypothetical protein
MNRKITFAAVAIAALVAGPAFAQQAPKPRPAPASQAVVQQNNVIVDGKVVGADPDPFIRNQLLREYTLQGPEW